MSYISLLIPAYRANVYKSIKFLIARRTTRHGYLSMPINYYVVVDAIDFHYTVAIPQWAEAT